MRNFHGLGQGRLVRLAHTCWGAAFHPGLTTRGLGPDRRSSPVAAQRCARGAGLDGMAEPQAINHRPG